MLLEGAEDVTETVLSRLTPHLRTPVIWTHSHTPWDRDRMSDAAKLQFGMFWPSCRLTSLASSTHVCLSASERSTGRTRTRSFLVDVKDASGKVELSG